MINQWPGKNVLVTGAGGFLGSTLTQQLIEAGANVRAFVRYNSRGDSGLLKLLPAQHLKNVEIIAGDLRDLPAVQNAVEQVEVVFHLGALIAIPYSYVHPVEVAETNIMGTINVMTACLQKDARMIHTSTSEVYGTALRVPIDEDHRLQGQSPYSASKIGADKMVESYYRSFGLKVVTVRPFNTYGPRQSARAVIPTIITQVINSDVIHLGNLDTRRDFTYVTDTTAGFIAAAQKEGLEGETFNLGTGTEVSIAALVEKIIRISGKKVEVVIDQQRLRPEKSEVMRLLSDNSKAKKMLGWEPMVNFDEGLAKTYAWVKENMHLYQPGVYQF